MRAFRAIVTEVRNTTPRDDDRDRVMEPLRSARFTLSSVGPLSWPPDPYVGGHFCVVESDRLLVALLAARKLVGHESAEIDSLIEELTISKLLGSPQSTRPG